MGYSTPKNEEPNLCDGCIKQGTPHRPCDIDLDDYDPVIFPHQKKKEEKAS